jgi:hypothetical protein
MWRMRGWKIAEIMDEDRLHLNAIGHQAVAIAVLDVLGVPHQLEQLPIPASPTLTAAEQRRADLAWARTHLGPWVQRRVTGKSSGDGVAPKRPELAPI